MISEILTVKPVDYIILGAVVLALIILFFGLYFWIITRKKEKRAKKAASDNQEQLLLALGGASNLVSEKLTRKRLEVEVNDISLLNQAILKDLKLGAIITKNTVKMLVKDNPKTILKYLKEARKGV